MTRFLPVAGTHGWRGQQAGGWWQAGSDWLAYMAGAHQCVPYNARRPFVWSTSLDGVRPFPWSPRRHLGWESAGHALYAYLQPPELGGEDNGVAPAPRDTRIVCHSHGLQVVLYACAAGLRVQRLISVGSPVRDDMRSVADAARPQIRSWTHVHSDGSDRWQWMGALTDGALGIVRAHPLADSNLRIPKVGHTGILTQPSAFHWWAHAGLAEVLRG